MQTGTTDAPAAGKGNAMTARQARAELGVNEQEWAGLVLKGVVVPIPAVPRKGTTKTRPRYLRADVARLIRDGLPEELRKPAPPPRKPDTPTGVRQRAAAALNSIRAARQTAAKGAKR